MYPNQNNCRFFKLTSPFFEAFFKFKQSLKHGDIPTVWLDLR